MLTLRSALYHFIAFVVFVCALPLFSVEANSGYSEIVFIDSSVQDASVLEKAVRPGVEVVNIDADRDGVVQMGKCLPPGGDSRPYMSPGGRKMNYPAASSGVSIKAVISDNAASCGEFDPERLKGLHQRAFSWEDTALAYSQGG